MPPKLTKAQRIKRSAKKAGQLIVSGAVSLETVGRMKLSRQTLESTLAQSTRNTPVARHASARLAGTFDGASMGVKKAGGSFK